MDKIKEIQKRIKDLPPHLVDELESYLSHLMSDKGRANGKFKQNWASGLKDYAKKYSAVELQKKSLEWRK